jgi:flagellin-specific chaperone FliS
MSTPYNAPTVSRYLDGRVLTASQPELQQMMLDGALRFGRQARHAWDDASLWIEVDRLVRRTLDVVEALIRSVGGGARSESKRLEDEYAFAFRELAAAHMEHAGERFDAALKLLEFQRETWRLACEKLKAQSAPAPNLDYGALPTSGFSFQA